MNTRMSSWLALPLLLLTGCPSGGGGQGGFSGGTPTVAYTANGGSNTVSGFTIDASGALTATNPATVSTNISNSEWLTVSRDGQLLYVSNRGNHTILGFTINPTTGILTSIGTPTTVPGTTPSPRGITITPNRQFLYVANDAGTIAGFSIGSGGALTPTTQGTITSLGNPRGITVSPNGSFLYVANSGGGGSVAGFAIGTDGTLTSMGATFGTPPNCDAEDLVVALDNSFLFVVCTGINRVAVFGIGGGGSLTAVAPSPSFLTGTNGTEQPQRITISRNGAFLYVTNTGTNEVAAFTIGTGGQLTRITPNTSTGATSTPVGITIDPTDQFVYVANSVTHEVARFSVGVGGVLSPTVPATFSINPNIPIGIATPGRP